MVVDRSNVELLVEQLYKYPDVFFVLLEVEKDKVRNDGVGSLCLRDLRLRVENIPGRKYSVGLEWLREKCLYFVEKGLLVSEVDRGNRKLLSLSPSCRLALDALCKVEGGGK